MKTPRNSPTHIFTKPKFKKDCSTKIMKPIPVKTITSNSKPFKSKTLLKPKYNNKLPKLPKLQQIQKIQTIIEEQLSHFSQEHEIQQYDFHQEEEKKQICCEEKEIESLKEKLNRI
jgi:hypothetical protein